MKRVFFESFIVLFLGIFANTQEAEAYDYCKFTCQDIDWEVTEYTDHVTDPYGCTWEFKYVYRYADCDEEVKWCEFRVISVEPISGTCDPQNFSDWSMLFDLIGIKIMSEPDPSLLPLPCEPQEGECSLQYSVSWGSCWKWEGTLGPWGVHDAVLVDCNEEQCCRTTYRICLNDDVRTVEVVNHDSGYWVCPSGECFNICE